MNKLPDVIWLQAGDNPDWPYEATWCEDQINEDDVAYISAEKVEKYFDKLIDLIKHGASDE